LLRPPAIGYTVARARQSAARAALAVTAIGGLPVPPPAPARRSAAICRRVGRTCTAIDAVAGLARR